MSSKSSGGTKYSIERNARWRWDHELGNPHMTEHLQERWDERTPAWSKSPEHAYLHGRELEHIQGYFTDEGGQTPDSLVYYAERRKAEGYGALLVIRDDTVVTMYRLASVENPAVRAFITAIEQEISA